MIKKLVYTLMCLPLTSCLNDKEIKSGWWKYGSGYHIGDVISLEMYDLRNDTLFLENTPKAILSKREGSYFGLTERKITIKDLKSDKTGIYHQKGKSE